MESILKMSMLIFLAVLPDICPQECKGVTMAFCYETIKNIKASKEPITYKKYFGFSFANFEPIDGKINEADFYEVGYNDKKQIVEIIRNKKAIEACYKLIVHEFPNFRVLFCQNKTKNSKYGFTPVAFFMFKKQEVNLARNFMINFQSQFGANPYKAGLSTEKFEIGNFYDISALMILDDELYPVSLFKFKDGYLVSSSEINYNAGSRTIDYEMASIYFNSVLSPERKITPQSCLEDIYSHVDLGDLTLPLHPEVHQKANDLPLWVFSGAHEYKR